MEPPRLAPVIGLGIPAILCAAANQVAPTLFLQNVTAWGALLFGASAAAWLMYALLVVLLDGYDRFKRSHAITPIWMVAEAVRGLTSDQLAMIPKFDYGLEVGFTYGREGWQMHIDTPGGNVPWAFVEEWLEKSSDSHLWPERSTAEGSDRRRWYQLLLQWAVYHGWAEPPVPGRPTRWVGNARRDIAHSLDIKLTDMQQPSVVIGDN